MFISWFTKVYLCSVLCSVIELLSSFFVFVIFSNIYVCFVFRQRSVVQCFFFFFFFFFFGFSILVMLFVANVSRLESFFSCILVLALYLSVYYDFYLFFSIFQFQMQLAKLTGLKVKQLWSGKTRFKEKELSNKIT